MAREFPKWEWKGSPEMLSDCKHKNDKPGAHFCHSGKCPEKRIKIPREVVELIDPNIPYKESWCKKWGGWCCFDGQLGIIIDIPLWSPLLARFWVDTNEKKEKSEKEDPD